MVDLRLTWDPDTARDSEAPNDGVDLRRGTVDLDRYFDWLEDVAPAVAATDTTSRRVTAQFHLD